MLTDKVLASFKDDFYELCTLLYASNKRHRVKKMKQQISFQTAFGKASFITFGNRQRGGRARAGGSIKSQAGNRRDGTNNSTTTVAAGTNTNFVAVNPVTNKIYVTNFDSNVDTVINGADNTTITVPVGPNPARLVVNSVTNKMLYSLPYRRR